ncbi:MAG: nucleotidyl transferase AbiEii/AbiGii toxin family protein [Pseudomonadales bacterium]
MPDQFLHLNAQEQKEILETLATDLGRKSNVLEKDVWVCWALDAMFTMPNALPMAFKGGTSLSKVFGAINRFSEDIDITVDYRALAERLEDEYDPFASGATNNQIRKYSDRLKEGLKTYAADEIVPHILSHIDQLPFKEKLNIEHSGDGEKISVHFPSVVEEQDDYLKSSILIELGGRNIIDPNAVHVVTPDIAGYLNNQELTFPTANAVVLAPERTFWEKATLIHSECHRDTLKANADRLSRHWLDLHLLNKTRIGLSALKDIDLLKDVVKYKKCFYRSGFANYDACLTKNFKLIPEQSMLDELEKDYRGMQTMIDGDVPIFNAIIQSLSELETTINQLI